MRQSKIRFRILTLLLAVTALAVLFGVTQNQIRDYLFPKPPIMANREFWKIVDDARKHGTSDDEIYGGLVAELSKLSDADIQRFSKRFNEREIHAYDMKLWGAIYAVNGGCGDDSFMDFRDYLIMMGEKDYTRIVNNPDSIIDSNMTPHGFHFKEMSYSQAIFELDRPEIDKILQNITALREFYKQDLPVTNLKNKDFDPDDQEVLKKELPRIWNYLQSRKASQPEDG